MPPSTRSAARDLLRPIPEPPPGFTNSRPEWVCYWYFTERKGYRVAARFTGRRVVDPEIYYQAPLYFPPNVIKGLTRADFLVEHGPGKRTPAPAGPWKSVVIDPYNLWTHPNPARDFMKRLVLALQGYRVVYVDAQMLEPDPAYVLELALRGRDISARGQGR